MTLNARQKDAVAIDHPYQCMAEGCENCYTTARYAAKCHKFKAVDLRDGSLILFSEEAEEKARHEDEARWAAIAAEYRYECSCGEAYTTIPHAIGCRKCRDYTAEGYCTKVWDRSTDEVVWELGS